MGTSQNMVHLDHRNGWDIYFDKFRRVFQAEFSLEQSSRCNFQRNSLAAVYTEIDKRPPFTLKAPMLVAFEVARIWHLVECIGLYSHRYGQGVRLRMPGRTEVFTRRLDGSVLRVDSQADVDALNALALAEKETHAAWNDAVLALRTKRNDLRLPYNAQDLGALQRKQARRIRDRARRASKP